MQTKTKPGTPAKKTVATPTTAVANNDTQATLATLEAAFERSYIATGMFLVEIRSRKLYKPEFETFDDYMAKRWKAKRPVLWNTVLRAVAKNEKAEAKAAKKTETVVAPVTAPEVSA